MGPKGVRKTASGEEKKKINLLYEWTWTRGRPPLFASGSKMVCLVVVPLWSRGAIRETGQNAMQLSSWTAKVWAPNWVLPTTSHVDSTGRAPVCCSACCLSFRKQSRSHLTEVLHVHAGEISQCLENLQDVLGTLGFLAVSRRRRTWGKMSIPDGLPPLHVRSLFNENCVSLRLVVSTSMSTEIILTPAGNSPLYWRTLEVPSDTRLALRSSFAIHTGPSCKVNTCTTRSWLFEASSWRHASCTFFVSQFRRGCSYWKATPLHSDCSSTANDTDAPWWGNRHRGVQDVHASVSLSPKLFPSYFPRFPIRPRCPRFRRYFPRFPVRPTVRSGTCYDIRVHLHKGAATEHPTPLGQMTPGIKAVALWCPSGWRMLYAPQLPKRSAARLFHLTILPLYVWTCVPTWFIQIVTIPVSSFVVRHMFLLMCCWFLFGWLAQFFASCCWLLHGFRGSRQIQCLINV